MSNILQQRLGTLQAAEQKVAVTLPKLSAAVKNESLKKTVTTFSQQTFTRLTAIGEVTGLMKLQVEPTTDEATNGIAKELETYTSSAPSPAIDLKIAGSLQKLLNGLATDYSFAANVAYEQKKEAQVITKLSESFDNLEKIVDELTTVTQQLFKDASSASESPPAPKAPTVEASAPAVKASTPPPAESAAPEPPKPAETQKTPESPPPEEKSPKKGMVQKLKSAAAKAKEEITK